MHSININHLIQGQNSNTITGLFTQQDVCCTRALKFALDPHANASIAHKLVSSLIFDNKFAKINQPKTCVQSTNNQQADLIPKFQLHMEKVPNVMTSRHAFAPQTHWARNADDHRTHKTRSCLRSSALYTLMVKSIYSQHVF